MINIYSSLSTIVNNIILFTFVILIVTVMNERLQSFLDAENISQAQFADTIGVTRASVSHILSGRNKPGFDFISSLMRCYPRLNIKWLLFGNGKMYDDLDRKKLDEAPENNVEPDSNQNLFSSEVNISEPVSINEPKTTTTQQGSDVPSRKIDHILVFYTDNTFEEIK